MMRAEDYAKLVEDLEHELTNGARSVGILGLTSTALRLLADLTPSGLLAAVQAIYEPAAAHDTNPPLSVPLRPLKGLAETHHDVLVVATDADKEDLLLSALPFVRGTPKVIVAGYGHLAFRDPGF